MFNTCKESRKSLGTRLPLQHTMCMHAPLLPREEMARFIVQDPRPFLVMCRPTPFLKCPVILPSYFLLVIFLLPMTTEALESPPTKAAKDSTNAHTPKRVHKDSLPVSHTATQSNTPHATQPPPHCSHSTTSKTSTSDSSYIEPLPDKPVQLVRPDLRHHLKLEIVEENVRHLHHIKTAVAVVAVVGKFHSGKSFLLNQLMGKTEGFGIGPYVRPQTMGIWMWGKVGINVHCVCNLHGRNNNTN